MRALQASDVMAELVAKADTAAAAAEAAVTAAGSAAGSAAARRTAAGAAAAVPKLAELFRVGQLVRCTVTKKQGSSEGMPVLSSVPLSLCVSVTRQSYSALGRSWLHTCGAHLPRRRVVEKASLVRLPHCFSVDTCSTLNATQPCTC